MTTPRMTSDRSADTVSTPWQRLLALSGVASAVLLVAGFSISGSDAPDYTAADQDWTNSAIDNESKNPIGALLILVVGFVFLQFAGMIRNVLGGRVMHGEVHGKRLSVSGAAVALAAPRLDWLVRPGVQPVTMTGSGCSAWKSHRAELP